MTNDRHSPAPLQALSFLFLVSGFAALIYQIIWQRVLFAAFGVNIECVTVTVSLFMVGLGVGSLVGGLLSRCFPRHAPLLFLLCEVAIGLFGLVSIPLIEAVSAATLQGSLPAVALAIYALLSLPTICMGATLPILVGHLDRHYANVGKSVGTLYFINTLGSAVACFLTADVLFAFLGQQAAVYVAAACNFAVAVLVSRLAWSAQKVKHDEATAAKSLPLDRMGRLRFVLMLLLAAATGYVSLSQEILWFRAISYITGGRPDVFAYLLGFFLFGVAFGSLLAKRVCERRGDLALPFVAVVLTFAGIAYFGSVPLSAWVLTVSQGAGLLTCYAAVAVIALLVGSVFPVVCHHAIPAQSATGSLLSWIYFANIVGATAGPLLTGFVLLEMRSLEQNLVLLSLATTGTAALVWLACPLARTARLAGVVAAALAATTMLVTQDGLYAGTLEKLHFKTEYAGQPSYKHIVQNRSGIITVTATAPDTLYGGGVYDGMFNIDPVCDANLIHRAYLMAAVHPEPADVLEIGLSTGSWARVVADHDAVRTLTSVEINAGYLDLVRHYPNVASLLTNPKVTIHIDDGRRWLNRHPDAKFDFILMNTTLHWRDHATNLLSAEFLRLCQSRLKPGGVVYFNSTGSADAYYTAATVFRHLTSCYNFVAASDSPFTLTVEQKRANLLRFRRDGRPVFDPAVPAFRQKLDELAASDTTDLAAEYRARRDLYYITDDNMAPEYKRCRKWLNPDGKWAQALNQLFSREMAAAVADPGVGGKKNARESP